MAPTKVHVGNLPDNCARDSLRDLFGPYGEINEVSVIKNFGFVHFVNESDARSACGDLDKTKLLGKSISVEIAKNQVPRDDRRRSEDRRDDGTLRYDNRRDRDRRDNPPPPRWEPRSMNANPPGGMGVGGMLGARSMNANPPGGMGVGGILGASPVEQNNLGNMGIFSTPLPAAEQEPARSEQQQPVRRDVNAGIDGIVIYERYYVDPTHPLLKGLPLPEAPIPRVEDTFVAPRRAVTDSFVAPRDIQRSDNRRDRGYNEYRNRSPLNQQPLFTNRDALPRADY